MRNLQFTGNFYGERITIKQIQKRTARKLFNSGETIYMQSSNFHPFGVWSQCIDIKKDINSNDSFDDIVNNFEYYNCSNEQGLYASFYKKIEL